MNVSCSHCSTVYRIDPRKVPAGGVSARCSVCDGIFPVAAEAGGTRSASPAPPSPRPTPETPPLASPFGSADPQARARRLARALVSDIAVYNPERRDRSLQEGSLKREFREEIRKSWEEYVGQVGERLAGETPYFRDALNEILARGQRVF